MGLFQTLKNKFTNKVMKYATSMRNYAPTYTQFGDKVMNDETVHQIVTKITNEYSKLVPKHIRTIDGKQVKVSDNNINNLLKRPNSLMTTSDFLSKIAWLREHYNNVFIYPSYDLYINKVTKQRKKVYTGLYPLQPVRFEFMEDNSGTYFVKFYFNNRTEPTILKYDEVIHWRKDFGENEFAGGSAINGLPNNTALLKHLELNDKLLQSTFKTVESSLSIKGVLKYGGMINEKDREKARLEFEEQLKNNESGIIAVDSMGDYVPIPYNGTSIDSNLLKFLDSKTRRHYGVSEAILDGDYSSEQKEAFYETVLEHGIISLGQAFTRVMITAFEQSNGNEIIFYQNKIQMMSLDKQMKLAEILLPVGGISPNEIREMVGLSPTEGGDETFISLNWVKKSIADEYQLNKLYGKNDDKIDDIDEETDEKEGDK